MVLPLEDVSEWSNRVTAPSLLTGHKLLRPHLRSVSPNGIPTTQSRSSAIRNASSKLWRSRRRRIPCPQHWKSRRSNHSHRLHFRNHHSIFWSVGYPCTRRQAHFVFLVTEHVNERGETRAQEVASEYARRNTEDGTPIPDTPIFDTTEKQQHDLQPSDRNSTAMHSVDALTYIDEDFNYYSSKRRRDSPTDHPAAPLVANADNRQDLGIFFSSSVLCFSPQSSIEYADPFQQQKKSRGGILGKILDGDAGRYPLEQQIANKRRGLVRRQQRPYVGLCTFLIVL